MYVSFPALVANHLRTFPLNREYFQQRAFANYYSLSSIVIGFSSESLDCLLYFAGKKSQRAMVRGAFIVLEGLDRAGKSTQVSMLIDALTKLGIHAEKRVFPGELKILDSLNGKNMTKTLLNVELKLIKHAKSSERIYFYR